MCNSECSGFVTSLLSLAPRYTASLSSISLFTAQLGALATPYIVSAYQTKVLANSSAKNSSDLGCNPLEGSISHKLSNMYNFRNYFHHFWLRYGKI